MFYLVFKKNKKRLRRHNTVHLSFLNEHARRNMFRKIDHRGEYAQSVDSFSFVATSYFLIIIRFFFLFSKIVNTR